jgi:hypothetical protein
MAAVKARSVSRLTWSILLITRIVRPCRSASESSSASASPLMPRSASISTSTRSPSLAPPQAVVTIARSSRRFGVKIPGVSMNTIWVRS